MPGGRPTKINNEISQRIVDYVRAGNYVETAAKAAGINKDTLYAWLSRGAKERDRMTSSEGKPRPREIPFLEFSDAVEKALGEAEIRDVSVISMAAERHWKAAAWRLERKFPDRWGRTDKHELTGKDGGPMQSDVSMGLTPQTAEAIRSEILGIGKDDE